jgi:Family of unknown function (DUF5681)
MESDIMPENTGKIQVKGKFSKGKSGNPEGRPKGARNRSTLLAERLFADEIEDICKMVIAEAKTGNVQAAKIVLDRLFPPRRDNPIEIDLPKMESSADLLKAIGRITDAVGEGQISPLEGEALARIIDIHAKALELAEFEQRLAALEKGKK